MPRYEHPDVIVFDLDPDTSDLWPEVAKTGQLLRRLLLELGLESFLKVTGGKGIHIHVPFVPGHSWDEVKEFARVVVQTLVDTRPDLYTLNMSFKKRGGKIFLDYLRNGFGATAIAPYCVRARATAAVALPTPWGSLNRKLRPDGFYFRDVLRRLRRWPDPWKDYFQVRQYLPALGKLAKVRRTVP